MTLLGPLCAFASSITWAFASSRYAQVAVSAGAVRVNFARALFACAAWTLAALVMHGQDLLHGLTPSGLGWLGLSIACSYVVGDGVFFAAAQRVGVSTALAVATVYPLWAALYGALLRGEPLSLARSAGLLGCVAGVIALLRLGANDGRALPHPGAGGSRAARVGIALALLTSLFWAGNAVCLKQGAQGISLVQANALRFTLGAVMLALRLLIAGRRAASTTSALTMARALQAPLLADVLVGSVCYVYGLANSDLALGVTLSSLSPLAALPMAALSGTERITPARAMCVCSIVGSVILLVS